MVQKQFEEEAREGLMEETTLGQAIERFGKALVIAAIGAIEEKGRTGEVHVIFDASNGVRVNYYIRVHDQFKCLGPGDVKAVLHEMSQEDGRHYASPTTSRRRIGGFQSWRRSGAAKHARSRARPQPP